MGDPAAVAGCPRPADPAARPGGKRRAGGKEAALPAGAQLGATQQQQQQDRDDFERPRVAVSSSGDFGPRIAARRPLRRAVLLLLPSPNGPRPETGRESRGGGNDERPVLIHAWKKARRNGILNNESLLTVET